MRPATPHLAHAMNSPEPSGPRRRTIFQAKGAGGVLAVLILGGIYSMAAPAIRRTTGLPLPTIVTDAEGRVQLASKAETENQQVSPTAETEIRSDDRAAQTASDAGTSAGRPSGAEPQRTTDSTTSVTKTKPTPLGDRMKSMASSSTTDSRRPELPRRTTPSADDDDGDPSLRYGLLREVSANRYISPAGLMYTPGSAEGHRLKHLERHTEDQPNRPGSHGVFDGGMEKALKTIDSAYERAKKNQRTTKREDRDRTILTVDMGGRVGYVGGRDGNRKRKPMARRVRLILEGNRVITAYPM